MKDAHMNTIGEDYILTGINKNAHVINRATYNLEKELNLKNREMSTSLVHKDLLYIGTYVDTLFIFSITNDFERIQLVRTHDSVLTMCSVSDTENRIVVGLAGGYVDLIHEVALTEQQEGDEGRKTKFVNESVTLNRDAGYINKVVLSNSGDEIIMACEKGIYIQKLNPAKTALLAPTDEVYLKGDLVSQVFEYSHNKLVATGFRD